MPNRKYEAGTRFERKVATLLRDDFWIVSRSAGSKSPFDLTAVKDNKCWHIQCKVTQPMALAKRINELQRFLPNHCDACIAFRLENGQIAIYGESGSLL